MEIDPFYYTSSIHHDGSNRYVRPQQIGKVEIGSQVAIRLRAAPAVPIERIFLRTCPDGEQQFVEMQLEESSGDSNAVSRWWGVLIHLSMPVTSYRFLIFTQDGVWWYNGSGLHRHVPTDAEDFRILAGYQAPAWVQSSVFYQIFPDRFANGDPFNDVRSGEFNYRGFSSIARPWGETPAVSGGTGMVEFFGGDLAGIQEHLDYLQDLGINALYLNPIFSAYSNHRYDVTDFFNVDPHLGGDSALVSLRKATAERGMRLILDIVPNHCGILHPWFQAALADPAAPTAEYFTFYHHPDDYVCWLGVRSLPKFNYRSQALREVIYASQEAVFRHWLRPPFSIDGWRLDVANMLARQGADQLGIEVGQGIRQAVKSEREEAYLLGENFFDASQQLQGDIWDATMNYAGFSIPVWYWLNRIAFDQHAVPHEFSTDVPFSTQALIDTWQAFRAAIPWQIAHQQFNLLGSHDTPRILSIVSGDEALNRLAVGLLMTYPGVPSVYYGDEIGLGKQPGVTRACMSWDQAEWDNELRAFYHTLIHLRRSSSALIGGGFQVLAVETDTLAYLRDSEDEQLVVIVHRGPGDRPATPLKVAHGAIPDGITMQEIFSQRRKTVTQGVLPLDKMTPGIEIWLARQ